MTLALGHKVSTKKPYWFHFLTQLSSDWDEILYDDKAIQVEHRETTFEWDLWIKGINCCFIDWSKKGYFGMLQTFFDWFGVNLVWW